MNIKEYTKYYKVGVYNFTLDDVEEVEFLTLDHALSHIIDKSDKMLYLYVVRDKLQFIVSLMQPCDKENVVKYLVSQIIHRIIANSFCNYHYR